jgi:Uma2 family endonuclease
MTATLQPAARKSPLAGRYHDLVAIAVDTSELHRLTAEEYHDLIETGAFATSGARVELIDGLLCDMSPHTPAHDLIVERLNTMLAAALDHERFRLRPTLALSLGDSEPEPDVAIVERGTPEPYHPASAALVIEVALSSRRRDLLVKPRLYARARVTEYWVIDVRHGLVVVHRDPTADGYSSRIEIDRDGTLDGGVIGIGGIAVGDVLSGRP